MKKVSVLQEQVNMIVGIFYSKFQLIKCGRQGHDTVKESLASLQLQKSISFKTFPMLVPPFWSKICVFCPHSFLNTQSSAFLVKGFSIYMNFTDSSSQRRNIYHPPLTNPLPEISTYTEKLKGFIRALST